MQRNIGKWIPIKLKALFFCLPFNRNRDMEKFKQKILEKKKIVAKQKWNSSGLAKGE
jgi:hypothetical protein